MASEWKKERLSELCEQIADCPHSTPLWTDSGELVLRSNNIRNGRLDLRFRSYTDEFHFKQRSRRARLRGGDLVITREAPMGEVCLIPDGLRCCLGQRMVMLRPDPAKCDSQFLLYSIQSRAVQDEIKVNEGTGSTVSNLRIPLLEALLISHPSLAEQKRIAAVLGALDDQIELNRQMNATLETMAMALFQSWFVDFDPVRAKLDARQPSGLNPATAELFPSAFEDSSVGHIPLGWSVGVLDELTHFVIGGDWGVNEQNEVEATSCYCIRGADIPSLQSGGVGKMPTRFLKPSSVQKRQLNDGDLAFEISGGSSTQSTGRPVLVSAVLLKNLGQPLVASNFCRIVKLKFPELSKFIYLWLRRLYDTGELFQFETGTTGIKNFAFVIFSGKYPLVIPELCVAEAFDKSVSPFFNRIQENAQQSRTLATLRDTLLPRLLSGELSVAQVEEVLA